MTISVLSIKPAKCSNFEQRKLCAELLQVAVGAMRMLLAERSAQKQVHVGLGCLVTGQHGFDVQNVNSIGILPEHVIDPMDPSNTRVVTDIRLAAGQLFPLDFAENKTAA